MRRVGAAARALLAGAVVAATLSAAAPSPAPGVQRDLLVQGHGLGASTLQRRAGERLRVERVQPIARDLGVVRVLAPAGTTAAAAARVLSAPGTVAAAPEGRFRALGASAPVVADDTAFAEQWALWDAASTARAGGYGIDAPRAWTRTTGSPSVVVAVLDTGITTHPNLAHAHLAPGYDFVDADADPSDPGDACRSDKSDSSWHGTFVTGEIAAQPGAGVAGAAPGVTIEPVRVLGPCGGDEATTVRGLLWAAGVPVVLPDGTTLTNPTPASVISMSLGGTSPCDAALQSAVDQAVAKGAVVVASAGNDGAAIAGASPAGCRGVVSVVATARSGRVASYSDHGTAAVAATIAAPGGDVDERTVRAGLVIGDAWTDRGAFTGVRSHAVLSYDAGTSMAAPLVSAAVALLRSLRPDLTPAEVVARLTASATPFPASAHCSAARCGAGIVNAGNLLGAAKRFVRVARPAIAGTAAAGHLLVASPGRWRSAPTGIAWSWLRDGVVIAGADGPRYRLTDADRGRRIGVEVTVLRHGYHPAHASASVHVRR